MRAKQVDITPRGIYYICPHCKEQMMVKNQCTFCSNCGGELKWDNVNEYMSIVSNSCYYEDTDNYCQYYKKVCNSSESCNYVKNNNLLNKYIGRLTSHEKDLLLYAKGYK